MLLPSYDGVAVSTKGLLHYYAITTEYTYTFHFQCLVVVSSKGLLHYYAITTEYTYTFHFQCLVVVVLKDYYLITLLQQNIFSLFILMTWLSRVQNAYDIITILQ